MFFYYFQANLFAGMGFDGLFFARIDYDDRKKRIEDRNMEFVWNAAHDQGTTCDIDNRSQLFYCCLCLN